MDEEENDERRRQGGTETAYLAGEVEGGPEEGVMYVFSARRTQPDCLPRRPPHPPIGRLPRVFWPGLLASHNAPGLRGKFKGVSFSNDFLISIYSRLSFPVYLYS